MKWGNTSRTLNIRCNGENRKTCFCRSNHRARKAGLNFFALNRRLSLIRFSFWLLTHFICKG